MGMHVLGFGDLAVGDVAAFGKQREHILVLGVLWQVFHNQPGAHDRLWRAGWRSETGNDCHTQERISFLDNKCGGGHRWSTPAALVVQWLPQRCMYVHNPPRRGQCPGPIPLDTSTPFFQIVVKKLPYLDAWSTIAAR